MAHFQLIDPDNPTALVGQLSKQGSGSFYVKPTSKNTTSLPMNGKAIVDILGREHIHHQRQQHEPTQTLPITPGYPHYEHHIQGTPYARTDPSSACCLFYPILQTFHVLPMSKVHRGNIVSNPYL